MTAEDASAPALSSRVRRQLVDLSRLAWPTVISRAGILTMVLVDVAMVSRYSTDELAYASLGSSLFVPLVVIGVGLMVGVIATTAQTFGAGREEDCAAIWYRALPFAALVGAISTVICLFGETILGWIGHTPEMAREGGKVAAVLAPGLMGWSFFVASTFFLEGLKRPLAGMIAMLAANIINIALNWVFIFGNLGAPEMGAVGSALTTTIVRCFLGFALVVYVLRMSDGEKFGIHGWPSTASLRGWWSKSAKVRGIGYAGGVSTGSETCAHSILTQFAGLIGVLPIAAYSIAVNVEAVMFMVALGFGAATAVMVGNAWGRGDVDEARLAGWVGLGTNIVVMGLCGLLIAVFAEPLAWAYTTDAALIATVVPLFALVGLVIVADGAQLTMSQAVRGLGDTWPATARVVFAFVGVMVPLGYWLGIVQGMGPRGLLIAMLVASLVSLVLQGMRFAQLLREGK